jgi:hypothetical protein
MMRVACFGLAALLVMAGVAGWWRPADPPVASATPDPALAAPHAAVASDRNPASSPEGVEVAAAADPPATRGSDAPAPRSTPVAPPAATPPPPAPAAPAEEATVSRVAVPVLDETEAVEIEPRAAFPEEGVADPWIEASVREETIEAEPAAVPAPVDLQRSGDLVRRLLAVHEAIRE